MRLPLFGILLLTALAAQAQNTRDPNSSDFDPVARMRRFDPAWQPRVVSQEELSKYPLGSEKRPVRTQGLNGQLAYLSRLLCKNGKAPRYERVGSADESPYGFPMDLYEVKCEHSTTIVHMDLYHPGFVEQESVPGLTLKDEH